ncbi:5'/3'-nucleotidase SurE [Succinimonas amylolytica]|uniref:5'/3'-nucleotidase SurE n=1 Tax=Succinimonas amylolytica TaxID=83769 RepID=UPI0003743026|nr:5'/3'-nucleotidase SurE [Succinimonas amylolytica]
MRILISNDDGIYAEGINRLYEQVSSEYPDTWVVAPDRNQSAASHSLTLDNPLRTQEIFKKNFTAVRGTPTDSVYLALNSLLNPRPDLVISGINEGANLGDDVIYSGTVAAAMEGRWCRYPALAVSLCGSRFYDTAAAFVIRILRKIQETPLPGQQILNVNVPDLPLSQIKGIMVTRLGRRKNSESIIESQDLRGAPIYWVGPQGSPVDRDKDTDFWAVENGYVSVTPLHVDLTAYNSLDDLGDWAGMV